MPQTLLAFLGVMILMFFTLEQQRDAVYTQGEILSTELEVMASALATEKIQYLAQRNFDRNANGNFEELATTDLTPAHQFGPPSGRDCWPDEDDTTTCPHLGQFDGTEHTATFAADTYTLGGGEIAFEFNVETEIDYVDTAGNLSSNRTWHKRARLTLTSEYMQHPVTITRRFSPLN